jgi:hypothetical protein
MTELDLSHPELAPAPTTLTPPALPSASDLEQTWHLAGRIAKTEFVPANLRNKPEAVLAVFLTGRELGIGPMQSLRDIYPVNGRPAMMATLMVSRVRGLGHRFRTLKSTDTEATVQIHRRGERDPEPAVTFTMDDARRAKLDSKDIWRHYPKAMLWNRAASACCRRDCSEALGAAVYTPEELDEIPASTTVQAGPAEVDGEPFEAGMPKAWAIDNIKDPEDAKWLLQQPEVGDDYREAVKRVVAAGLFGVAGDWAGFWRTATATQWREVLRQAAEQSDPGSRTGGVGSMAPGDAGESAPHSPGSDQSSGGGVDAAVRSGALARKASAEGSSTPSPDPKSPPSPNDPEAEPTEADRSRAEGAHVDGKPGTVPPDGATTPPEGSATPPGRPSGGNTSPAGSDAKGARPGTSVRGRQRNQGESHGAAAGRLPTGEQGQAERDPKEWTR